MQREHDEVAVPADVEAVLAETEPIEDELEQNLARLQAMPEEQREEAEQYAVQFLIKVMRLRGVRIDRAHFLRTELHKRGIAAPVIDAAIAVNPAAAGIAPRMLDEIATSSIEFETRKSTALSFAAGLPGGFAMFGTVPADITQFYVHAFRIMQKCAYLYGWQSFLDDVDHIDDETLGKLAAFLGVMMGVGGASASLSSFASKVAAPAVQKQVAKAALTKTAWYPALKQVLRLVGVQVTKDAVAKTVSKVVPVVGGVVSGSMTYATLNLQSRRLMRHLRELPPPNVDAAEYLSEVREASGPHADEPGAAASALRGAVDRVKSSTADAAGFFRSVDLDGDGVPDEARSVTAAKNAGSAVKGAAKGVSDKFGSLLPGRRATRDGGESDASVPVSD